MVEEALEGVSIADDFMIDVDESGQNGVPFVHIEHYVWAQEKGGLYCYGRSVSVAQTHSLRLSLSLQVTNVTTILMGQRCRILPCRNYTQCLQTMLTSTVENR